MLFKEYFHALWSVPICKLIKCGFGMANIGMQYMSGRSLSPKDSEKWPMKILWSRWSHKNCASLGFLDSGKEESRVSGYSPIWVLAQGQKPSQSPQQTDLTKGWCRCNLRISSNWSMKIGVTMLKRWGFSLIVLVTMGLASSDFGIAGNADAVSVQSAEKWEKCSPPSHIFYLRYLGWSSYITTFFDITRFLPMTHSLAPFAGVSDLFKPLGGGLQHKRLESQS